MVDGSSRMEPRTQLKNTGRTERLEDQGKDGKMTSTNSSNLLKTRQKTLLKAAAKSTKHGSTQQKTAEDGLYSKKRHNDFRRTTPKIMRERE